MPRIKVKRVTRILNCKGSSKTENDWTLRKALSRHDLKDMKLPDTVDLRQDWWDVANQGTTGSCVGWASADGVMRWHMVKKRKLKHKEKLSVRFVWMASKEMDEFSDIPSTFIEDAGTSLKCALDVLRKHGCVKESVLPFGEAKLFPGDETQFFAIAEKMKISAYYNLLKGKRQDKIRALKRWLASGNGPILTCVEVDNTWQEATTTKGYLEEHYKGSVSGGHAVCIVGYTPEYFIIRNSWGEEWGDKGFAYASYDYVREVICEAYGVTVD
jgi:C1A family cysteine protease